MQNHKESVPLNVTLERSKIRHENGSYSVEFIIKTDEDFNGFITDTLPLYVDVDQQDNIQSHYFVVKKNIRPRLPFDKEHEITLRFGDQPDDNNLFEAYKKFGIIAHDGVDFIMPENTLILAIDDGVVIPIPEDGSYGKTVVVRHLWGTSYYGHLNTIAVKIGQKVKKGDVVAISGNTGLSTGPHLHLSILLDENDRSNGYYGKINPLPLMHYAYKYVQSTQKLYWRISLKKGDVAHISYAFTVREGYKDKGDVVIGPAAVLNSDYLLLGRGR